MQDEIFEKIAHFFSYENIGRKIKGVAIFTVFINALLSIIALFYFLSEDDYPTLVPLLIMLGILIGGFILSWLIYGFGEIVDKLCDIERNTRNGNNKSETQDKADIAKKEKLENLRAKGLISEEEYQEILSKKEKAL